MEGQDEQDLHSSQTTKIIKGKRTKRQRPQSPIPFPTLDAKSDEGSDICSNNHNGVNNNSNNNHNDVDNNNTSNNNNNNSTNNTMVDVTSTAVSDDQDSHQITTTTEEEEEMANCLILLAQSQPYTPPPPPLDHSSNNIPTKFSSRKFMDAPKSSGGGYYVYECKTCSKTFPSFQALGGHRASHKKPKIKEEDKIVRNSYAYSYSSIGNLRNFNNAMVLSSDEELENKIGSSSPSLSLQLTNRAQTSKARVHECAICGAEFASGQALGGHMRRHRGPVAGNAATGSGERTAAGDQLKLSLDLDLNLPAPSEDNAVVDNHERESQFVFASKQPQTQAQAQDQAQAQQQQQQQQPPSPPPQQNQLVFSSAALVDCHY